MNQEFHEQEQDEQKLPKSLENTIDFKANYVSFFGNLIELLRTGEVDLMQLSKRTKLTIVTNFGNITADLLDFPEEEDFQAADKTMLGIRALIKVATDSFFADVSEAEEMSGDGNPKINNHSKIVHLKNVIVKPFSNPNNITTYPYLAIFSDQIVGLSLAETPQD